MKRAIEGLGALVCCAVLGCASADGTEFAEFADVVSEEAVTDMLADTDEAVGMTPDEDTPLEDDDVGTVPTAEDVRVTRDLVVDPPAKLDEQSQLTLPEHTNIDPDLFGPGTLAGAARRLPEPPRADHARACSGRDCRESGCTCSPRAPD